ncbi:hypothetical protein [Microbispora triticiradicis]|uniref:hypothetical protein n=1 Tax=Microbispora triticiradicis TaxID=2200763 RepID=UPI001AD6BC0B|nr:hypothetical protein [Microbispora triticiradicis]MBO4275715.1 hypothetical protein [Microbispora triticiradicis]
MSIWSTFKTIEVHDAHLHSEATPGQCQCPDRKPEVWLSRAWSGFPLRLTASTTHEEADVALTRDQARELARELIAWADDDEQREAQAKAERQ